MRAFRFVAIGASLLAITALAVFLTFFSTTGPKDPHTTAEIVAATAYWQPWLLLTSDKRYRKLHVEIDAVEGTAPTPEELASLSSFLEEHCAKPDGIEVVLDDEIPRSEAEGRLSRSLALDHLDGPPDGETAFLYFLFYDSSLSDEEKAKPITMMSPSPGAIFVDHQYVNYQQQKLKDFRRRVMLHEAGHALGLTRNVDHGDGLHCTNEKCLMNAELRMQMRHFFIGGDPLQQKEFCADCLAGLAANRTADPPENLRYFGPYLIRSEEHYHAVLRPNFIYIHVGEIDQIDREALETGRQQALQDLKSPGRIYVTSAGMDWETATRVSKALLKDPVQTVRNMGKQLTEQLRQDGVGDGEGIDERCVSAGSRNGLSPESDQPGKPDHVSSGVIKSVVFSKHHCGPNPAPGQLANSHSVSQSSEMVIRRKYRGVLPESDDSPTASIDGGASPGNQVDPQRAGPAGAGLVSDPGNGKFDPFADFSPFSPSRTEIGVDDRLGIDGSSQQSQDHHHSGQSLPTLTNPLIQKLVPSFAKDNDTVFHAVKMAPHHQMRRAAIGGI